MAKRSGEGEAGLRADAPLPGPTERRSAPQSLARLAILSTLLLLAIYSAFAVLRIQREPQAATLANTALPHRAEALAAHLDAEGAALTAGAAAARDMLQNDEGPPVDVARRALSVAGAAGMAAAVVADDGVAAAAGQADGVDWLTLSRLARKSGQPAWAGASDHGGLAAGAEAATAKGRRWILVLGDPARVAAWLAPLRLEAAIGSGGRILAARGAPGIEATDSLATAFGLSTRDLDLQGRPVRARRPDGAPLDLSARPALGGEVIALSAAPAGPSEAQATMTQMVWVLAPLGAAFVLGLILLVQSNRADRAHKAFTASEHRFRLAVEAARCGIWEWDLEADKVFMSEVTGAIFGWSGGGVADGAELLERVSPDHRARVRLALDGAAAYGGFDVSFRVPNLQGGRPTWVDARGQAFTSGPDGQRRIIGVALDVTEERMAEVRAQAAETRLRDAIDSVSEAFVLWDRGGRLLMCNTNYRTFFSLEPRLLKPGAVYRQVAREAQKAIRQEHPAADGAAGQREVELHDGRWLQISERRTAEGGRVMTAADITAVKAQEEARRLNELQLQKAIDSLEKSQEQLSELARKYEAEKVRAEAANRAKSEFLANMSHELRTPLNAINGFSEIMVQEMFGPLGDPRYQGYSQDILSSGQHLLALINDILDMSKIEAGKLNLLFEPMSIEDVTEDALRLVQNRAESQGLDLAAEFPERLPEVEADYRAVKQVLLNLLSNAIKFTPRGGKVTVRAELQHEPGGERLKISVQDTGIGIAPSDLARLARPFEQVETQHSKTTQGTGLGLALTKSLVEMHGGLLDLKSVPGVGTTVSFSLPVHMAGHGFRGQAVA